MRRKMSKSARRSLLKAMRKSRSNLKNKRKANMLLIIWRNSVLMLNHVFKQQSQKLSECVERLSL
jgi:hypothetical protein